MNITLRERESKKTGRITLYLEIYKGYDKSSGKTKHIREYEYLDYYLISNPKTPAEKQHNKESKKAAEAVEAQRRLEIQNGIYGFNNTHKLNTNFIEYFKKLTQERFNSAGNYGNWDSTLKHLLNYTSATTTFKEITVDFCENFKAYLLNTVRIKNGNGLSINAASSYFNKFKAAMNQAYEDRIINDNPVKRVKSIKPEETRREYLTKEEIQKLMSTECRYEVLKNAFLFSCLTGLRWSDIQKLTCNEVQKFNDGLRIVFTQRKTKGIEYLDIHPDASKYMGNKTETNDRVFVGLKYSAWNNIELTKWMLKAGITKDITFHCARHSHATLLLSGGVDIYTVSKMLGHKELKTTQIYTKVIDQKKQEAINVFNDMVK